MKILVIDDDDVSLKMFRNALRLNGYDCKSYLSPLEALAEIKNTFYDIIFTDFNMPDLDGIELIREVRKVGEQNFLVLCSGFDDGTLENAAKKSGADGFMQKPINWQMLNELLENLESQNIRTVQYS